MIRIYRTDSLSDIGHRISNHLSIVPFLCRRSIVTMLTRKLEVFQLYIYYIYYQLLLYLMNIYLLEKWAAEFQLSALICCLPSIPCPQSASTRTPYPIYTPFSFISSSLQGVLDLEPATVCASSKHFSCTATTPSFYCISVLPFDLRFRTRAVL